MPTVYIPPLMRDLTNGEARVEAPGRTVRAVVEVLDVRYPGIRDRLCAGEKLVPTMAVAVDGRLSRLGLLQPVTDTSEVRFLPAIEGG